MKPTPNTSSGSHRNRQQSFRDRAASLTFTGLLGLGLMLLGAVINDWRKPETRTKYLPCDCTNWKHKCCETCRCLELESE